MCIYIYIYIYIYVYICIYISTNQNDDNNYDDNNRPDDNNNDDDDYKCHADAADRNHIHDNDMLDASDGSDVTSNPSELAFDTVNIPEQDDLEPWAIWIQRTTRAAEKQLAKLNIESWVTQVRRNQWKFFTRLLNQPTTRWSKRSFLWEPTIHFDGTISRAGRRQARPRKRWSDDFQKMLGTRGFSTKVMWEEVAGKAELWQDLGECFISGAWCKKRR